MNDLSQALRRRLPPAGVIFGIIFILLASLVMVRLGFWQLDRLAQRRAFNARVANEISAPILDLNQLPLPENLADQEYRSVQVRGTYDLAHQVELRNQPREGALGVHLLTPLIIEGTQQIVLVDRGWAPYETAAANQVSQYDEPGVVNVHGVFRRSQPAPLGILQAASKALVEGRLPGWPNADLNLISEQTRLKLLPVYIQALPDNGQQGLLYRNQPNVELSEGPHLGYAIQWFTFAAVLPVGFALLIRQRALRAMRKNSPVEVIEKPEP